MALDPQTPTKSWLSRLGFDAGAGPAAAAVPGLAAALIAAVLAMYGAQFLIGALPKSPGWGIGLMALSVALLVLRLRGPAAETPGNVLQMALGLLFILPLALDVDQWKAFTPAWQLIAVWVLGCGLMVLTLLRFRSQPLALQLKLQPWGRLDWLMVGLLLGGALLLRVPGIETMPLGVDPDEGSFALSALDMATGAAKDPFATGWVTHPTLQFYLNGFWVNLFGRTILTMRLPSALMGTLAVLAIYLLARVTFGRRVAVLAGALALGSDVLIQFSRLGINNISDVLFMAWTMAALWYAGASGRPWGYALAGIGLGLSQYYYFGARAIPFVVLATLVMWLLADPRGVWRARYLLLGGVLVSLAVAGPLAGHIVRFPGSITEHLFLTIPFSEGAQARAVQMHLTIGQMWWQQVRDSLLVFTVVADRGSFYHPKQALLSPVQAPMFLIGLLVLLAGWRRPISRGLLAWLAIVLLLGSVLMTDAAAFHRLLGIVPAVILVVALGVDTAVSKLGQVAGWTPRETRLLLGTALAVLVFANINFYFRVYGQREAFKPPDQEAASIAALEYERLQGRGQFVLVTNDGVDAAGKVYHTPITFVAGNAFLGGAPQIIDQLAAGTSAGAGSGPRPLYFYVLSDRAAELPALMARFPGGQLQEYHRKSDNLLVMTRYAVP